MTNTFGPELDAELAYRRETLLRRRSVSGDRGWLARVLRSGEVVDPSPRVLATRAGQRAA